MTEDTVKNEEKSWLDRLSHALLREPQDRQQLVELLRDAEARNLLDADALSMIEGVLQVSVMQVRDIMIPRTQMVAIQEDQSLEELLPTIVECAHSRFPVLGDNRDAVVGILHAKDLLVYFSKKDSQDFDLSDIIRPAVFVPESKPLDVLLKEFRNSRNHMAIVVDEYGGMAGFVTIEDVLEQIVGEIADEFDIDEDAYIKKHSDTRYMIKALTPLEDFNDYFDTQFAPENIDTIGGYLMSQFGRMPEIGESIDIGEFHFEVTHADKRRIHLLAMTINAHNPAA